MTVNKMLAITTELPYRIILTVLLLGTLGNTADLTTVAENEHSDHNPQNSTSEQDESAALSRSMPFYDKVYHHHYADYRDSPYYNAEKKFDRDYTPSGSTLPSSIISSTSYSVKPGSGSGTNVYMNTKPVPIIISADRGTTSGSSEYSSRYKGSAYYDFPRRDSPYQPSHTRDDCYNGRNCPKTTEADDHRTYYSVLNGNVKYPDRPWGSTRLQPGGNRRNDEISEPVMYDRFASFPFRVRPLAPEKDRYLPEIDEDDDYKRRVTRTSTSAPGWVKLQPIMSHKTYDPFLSKNSQSQRNTETGEEKEKPQAQFANRIGIEISPESFAERWGWGSGSSPGSGSRLPTWLEEYNHKYEHRVPNNGPTRDEDTKNWVKLDPIPVAGVSISKWVPKGTSPSDLPSTSNRIRDKHQPWWDRPELPIPVIKNKPHYGWSSSNNHRRPSYNDKKHPSDHTDAWKDIIYPDTPTSATASWVESSTSLKGISAYPSSYPSTSSGWKSDALRRPSVASWTAPGSSGSHHRFNVRRPTGSSSSSNYPDPHAGDDDPRWVLVSNTRRVTGGHHSDRHRYRPNVDRWRDDMDLPDRNQDLENERESYYKHHSHRVAKNVQFQNVEESRKQDEAFSRVNATLQTLTPVLNHRENATATATSTSKPKPVPMAVKDVILPVPKRTSFLSSLLGGGRKFSETTTTAPTTTVVSNNKASVNGTKTVVHRRPLSMKPILAAVGAGMIPATMAAVLPMVMGRRKKRDVETFHHQYSQLRPIVVNNQLIFVPSEDFSRRSYIRNNKNQYLNQLSGRSSPFTLNRVAR